MATYELWEMKSGNLMGSWTAEADALAVVHDAVVRHGAEKLGAMALLVEDQAGQTTMVAEGSALIERARPGGNSPGKRSA